jgi:hypothetical protein
MRLPRKIYTTRTEKTLDFLIGFIGWWVLNLLLTAVQYGVLVGATSLTDTTGPLAPILANLPTLISLLGLVLNIVLIIALAFVRHWIALGLLAGFASALLLVLCLGIVVGVACLVILGSSQGAFQ